MRRLLSSLAAVVALAPFGPARAEPPSTQPLAVVALVDTGINPYSPAFRDTSPLAYRYPAEYIPSYPAFDSQEGAITLNLTLDPPAGIPADQWTYDMAYQRDKAIWDLVFPGFLYWIPGTKIVGAVSLGSGGTNCKRVPNTPPAGGTINGLACTERKILDDAGHGTMTASRVAANGHSLGERARIVEIEGPGAASVLWAARQPWIDVQSISWGFSVPATPNNATSNAFKEAARTQTVLVASGNGIAINGGVAPSPTQVSTTHPNGVVIVGAHDNGKVSQWSSAPAHVVADGYGGWTGIYQSLVPPRPDLVACCTSAAAPYAAGAAAAILLEARAILGDAGVGARDGNVAIGTAPPEVTSGPLADGALSLAELYDLILHTAQARPTLGRDDGLINFLGGPKVPDHPELGPGENPFCLACTTLPVNWTDMPAEFPAHYSIGYGALNEFSVATARAVMLGQQELPKRAVEDEFFRQDREIRNVVHGQ